MSMEGLSRAGVFMCGQGLRMNPRRIVRRQAGHGLGKPDSGVIYLPF